MIKRYFYIFSTTLFILLSSTTGIKADTLEKRLHEIERQQKAPPGFNYQAALRDSNGEILANTAVTLRFTIQTATDGGTIHWVETHTTTTNAQGLVNVVIGEGARSGGEQETFEAIPFSESDTFLKVEVDTGTGFEVMGAEQLQSVPYAMVSDNGLTAAQAAKLDELDENAEQNVQADWDVTDANSDAFIKNKPNISGTGEVNVQADWNVADNTSDAYIQNKPTTITNAERTKLTNIEDGAEVNIQSDWNQADDSQPDYIHNKPNIDGTGEVNVQADWNETDPGSDAHILNKPTLFDGSFTNLTDVPANLDTDATDDFDGAFGSLTGVPANLDTDATDDFDGAFGSLSGVPANLDTDATDDFDGAFGSLTGVPANLDTDATDDFDGSFNNLTDVPANLDTDDTDDLTTADLAFTTASQITSNAGGDLTYDSFLFGGTQFNDDTDPNHDNRMFFEKSTGAFRVGRAQSVQWDTRGDNSFAAGQENEASGNLSFAGGGSGNTASGGGSFVGGGYGNDATHSGSFVGGGVNNSALGFRSSIVGGAGNTTVDSSYGAVGGGQNNTASGFSSTIPGGQNLTAESWGQITMGTFNTAHPGTPASGAFVASDRLLVVGNGQHAGDLSDALVMLKNGNTTLNGQLTLSDGANPFTLPNADGADGQVLKTDGAGNVSWQADNGAFATTATNLISNVGGDLANDSFLFGSTSMDDVAGTDDDRRMFFDKNSGAFRIGRATGNEWDIVGANSFVSGNSNTSSSLDSFIGGGTSNSVSGGSRGAIVGGNFNDVSGNNAFIAGGSSNEATGQDSGVVGGQNNDATGNGSTAIGGNSHRSEGNNTFIGGGSNNEITPAGASSAIAGGISNYTSGLSSFIGGGREGSATGYYSAIIGGRSLTAESWGQITMGSFNTTHPGTPNATMRVATDRLLVVGNGTANNDRSDALVMLKNGDTNINGNVTVDSLGVAGAFGLPIADGADGQVLQTDGAGNVGWGNAGAFTTAANLISNNDPVNESFLFGGIQFNDDNDPNHDNRMFFDKSTGSFRVGRANSTQWDTRGLRSFASGYSNTASGANSFAGGGIANIANASNAFIGGGDSNSASGVSSSVGGGLSNTALGYQSAIPGGSHLTAESWGQITMGTFNIPHPGTPNTFSYTDTDRLLVVGNGQHAGARSDALVMLKNGNTTLNGQLTLSDGASPFTLPNADGADGQVLKTDGAGNASWQADNGAFATTATNLISNVGGDLANDSFLVGSTSMDDTEISSQDIRMFFDKSTRAFRAGSAASDQWDTRGFWSFATGQDNTASASWSSVGGGLANSALATAATVGGGALNSAYGNYSAISGGRALTAESWGQISMGTFNTAHPGTPNATMRVATDRLLVVGNGTDNNDRSDALVMLKNGDTDINGNVTVDSLGVAGAFGLPVTDGPASYVMQTAGDGTVTWQDPTAISSDRRLKTNIKDLTNVLAKMSKLEGYRFNWNEVQNRNQEVEEIGLIAQEVQELYPELVSTDKDGYLRVKYISFVPLLLEAIKELEAKNESLETKNEQLLSRNDALEARQSKDEERFTKLESQLEQLMKLMVPTKETVGKN